MPTKKKTMEVTKEQKTIRQLAKELREEEPNTTLTPEPRVAVQTSSSPLDSAKMAQVEKAIASRIGAEIILPTFPPLFTLHLRRIENEITDSDKRIHIPAPATIQEGEKVVLFAYKEE
ncbi:MAG: hypothetical protein KJ556_21325 [Gammaproteobacteria bacterium]|nr:hypothetical protein [Gammaproteobacteria bacterium]